MFVATAPEKVSQIGHIGGQIKPIAGFDVL
jgi:hypothetical protein